MKKLFTKLFFSIALLLIVGTVSSKVFAINYLPGPNEFSGDLNEGLGADAISYAPMKIFDLSSLFNGLYCLSAGSREACGPQAIAMNPNLGLIPKVTQVNLAMIHNQPAGLGIWVADAGQSLGFLPKQTMAQGVGFSGLVPILSIWKIFRNIAYLMLSVALIIVGFMVMFRRKIDPQTVVTIQDALPRVIIALILITFSYAIVAILIDVLYIVLLLVYGVFSTGNLLPATRATTGLLGTPTTNYQTQDVFLNGSVNDAIGIIFPNNFSDFGALLERITGTSITTWSAGVGAVAGGFMGNIPGMVIGAGLGSVAGPAILQFLVALLIAILMIRLFFMFLGAYVQIILRLILGPIQIALGVLPGNDGFGGWMRAVVSQLSVFATAGIMFMLATVFSIIAEQSAGANNQAMWKAPYLPGAGSTESVAALFCIGILMLIPSVVKQVQQTIVGQHGQELPLGGAIMGGFHGVSTLGLQLFNLGMSEHHNRQLREAMAKGAGRDAGGGEHHTT